MWRATRPSSTVGGRSSGSGAAGQQAALCILPGQCPQSGSGSHLFRSGSVHDGSQSENMERAFLFFSDFTWIIFGVTQIWPSWCPDSYLPVEPSYCWVERWGRTLVSDLRPWTWSQDDHQPFALLHSFYHLLQVIYEDKANALESLAHGTQHKPRLQFFHHHLFNTPMYHIHIIVHYVSLFLCLFAQLPWWDYGFILIVISYRNMCICSLSKTCLTTILQASTWPRGGSEFQTVDS